MFIFVVIRVTKHTLKVTKKMCINESKNPMVWIVSNPCEQQKWVFQIAVQIFMYKHTGLLLDKILMWATAN
jgi:hypothetical protein